MRYRFALTWPVVYPRRPWYPSRLLSMTVFTLGVTLCILSLLFAREMGGGRYPRLEGEELDLSLVCPGPGRPPRLLPRLDTAHLPSRVVKFLEAPVVNPHEFGYFHNPDYTCQMDRTEVLFVVPSAPDNFYRRELMRESLLNSWVKGHKGHRHGQVESPIRASLLFFVALPRFVGTATHDVQYLLNQEARRHRDIVQADFVDTYSHVRLKHVMMLRWAATYCSGATYVIRVDDDAAVDPDKIVKTIYKIGKTHKNFVVGKIKSGYTVYRGNETNPNFSKYGVTVEEYPGTIWPPFALGGLLGYPSRTVRLLYEASLRVKAVWLDDVYITGICAPAVNTTLLSDPDFTFAHTWPD